MHSAGSNSLTNATIDHLSGFAPFDRMQREHLEWMTQRLTLDYYAKGTVLLSPEQGVASRLFIIKQGIVQGEQDVARAEETSTWLELTEGECFPLGALIANRAVSSVYRAKLDTFCYELSAADFLELIRISPAFHDFCTRRIANLLEHSKSIIQAQYAQSSTERQSLTSPLSSIIRRAPVTCAPDTPLWEALETMQRLHIGSMIAVKDSKPVGIFTLHDVLSRVTLPRIDLAQPIIGVMSTQLTTLPPQAFAYEAAIAMAKHGIRHVLVTDSDRLVGVISEKDLFTLQRVGLRQVSMAIRNATDLESLKHSAQDIHQLAHVMLAQGVAVEQLTQLISTLNDLLTCRIIELEMEVLPADQKQRLHSGFCWLAFGSEGRLEQTLNTDQDNGIIFPDIPGQSPDAVREILLSVAERINRNLDSCGFPLCKGNIMASNPQWCLSLSEWKNTFADWIHRGNAPVLLNASIFFDFRPVYGDDSLASELRRWLNEKIKDNRLFLRNMAVNALANRPPLGLIQDFSVSNKNGFPHSIDLKINGVTPFVDAARIFSLAAGISETNTTRRLRAIAEQWKLDKPQVEAWTEAFSYIQLLRMRLHHDQTQHSLPLGNRIDPDTLNNLDRRILKEAFRQARKLQALLESVYQF